MVALQTSALSLVGRFGPHDNVVVEVREGEAHISAYGDAPVVRLRGSLEELKRCESAIRTTKATRCDFTHGGSLTFIPVPGGRYRFTFSDAVSANIVDFDADEDALRLALVALSTPTR